MYPTKLCEAIRKDKKRCNRPRVLNGLCVVHYGKDFKRVGDNQ
jgi:hypothetical protein